MESFTRSIKRYAAALLIGIATPVIGQAQLPAPAVGDEPLQKIEPPDHERLVAKIRQQGSARIIVGVTAADDPLPPVRSGNRVDPGDVERRRQAVNRLQERVLGRLDPRSLTAVTRFNYIPYLTLEVNAQALERLVRLAEVDSIREVQLLYPTLPQSIPLIKASTVWSSGYSGQGQAVAILDTGVDKAHSFLSGKVIAEGCFSTTRPGQYTSLCPGGAQTSTNPGSGVPCTGHSDCFHGTHVAGIAAGKGSAFSGVAKDAQLIAVQVFSRPPSGRLTALDEDLIQALEYIFSLRHTHSVASVNMSLGGGLYTKAIKCDNAGPAFKAAVDNLRVAGIATVIASGNGGNATGIAYPGCISTAVSVGATSDSDSIASFSNRASWLTLFAPGVSIQSSLPGGGSSSQSGTSMATPHVAGAIAVIRSKAAQASVDQVLAAMTNTGIPIRDSASGFIIPRLDLNAAAAAFAEGAPPPVNMILDNDFAGAIVQGSFSPITNPAGYNGKLLKSSGTGVDSFQFDVAVPETGYYQVYAWWQADSANSNQAVYNIQHALGLSTVVVDQRIKGKQWNQLGVFLFDAGSPAYVEISDENGLPVVADAVRFKRMDSAEQDVIVDNGDPETSFTGTWEFVLRSESYQGDHVNGIGNGVDTYRFTPNIAVSGQYRVYAQWRAHSSRSTRVAHDIQHAAGTTTVEVNQQINGGQWNELGVFFFNAGTQGYVEVSDRNGILAVADAIRLEYVSP